MNYSKSNKRERGLTQNPARESEGSTREFVSLSLSLSLSVCVFRLHIFIHHYTPSSMISHFIILNTIGLPRLTKHYVPLGLVQQQRLLRGVFNVVSGRPESSCAFVEDEDLLGEGSTCTLCHSRASVSLVCTRTQSLLLYIYMCVCVRERERERSCCCCL